MPNTIVVNKEYFDNIKIAIDCLNGFFTSGLKNKNFPVLDDSYNLDNSIMAIVESINHLDPTWIDDSEKVESAIQKINEVVANTDINDDYNIYETILNSNDKSIIDTISAFTSFKMVQFIADHFDDFGKLVNAIYSMEMFLKPSMYTNELDIFTRSINTDEVPELGLEVKIFDVKQYVDGILANPLIKFSTELDLEGEIARISNGDDLNDFEIVVNNSVQEAAEVNYFEGYKPLHLKYNEKDSKWIISKQFEKVVNDLISGLRKCDTTDDLIKYFNGDSTPKSAAFFKNICPFILGKLFSNEKKYPVGDYDDADMKKYIDSYKSIADQGPGPKRYQNYDIFSTFKTDKDGTIQFLEDFLKLNIVNKKDIIVSNHTLLIIFNIFDSRIYFDIMYNLLPEEKRTGSYATEDGFVKEIRARLNKNSRESAAYNEDPQSSSDEGKDPKTSEEVQEYVAYEMKKYGDMSFSDIVNCEHYQYLLSLEAATFDDSLYNEEISNQDVNNFIGESYEVDLPCVIFQEANVMNNRERLQAAVANLVEVMTKIVQLDRSHRWTNNAFADHYKTFLGQFFFTDRGAESNYTDLKSTYVLLNRAIKGKMGTFKSDEMKALTTLKDICGEIWKTVKIFWVTPVNFLRHYTSLRNGVKQKATRTMAELAMKIVRLKPSIQFILNDKFVTESLFISNPGMIIYEQESGEIPDYIASRIKFAKETDTAPEPTLSSFDTSSYPSNTPLNSIDDLAGSIDSKLSADGSLEDMLGTGYEENANKGEHEGKVVINITNNYTHSFNKDSYHTNTSNKDDHSVDKTTSITDSNNDESHNKHIDSSRKSVKNVDDHSSTSNVSTSVGPNNNNNSSNVTNDTKDSTSETESTEDNEITLSNGMTLQEMFMVLESKEPQSLTVSADPPKEDLLTKSMDFDRKTLPAQQEAKKGTQKFTNTIKGITKVPKRTKQWFQNIVDSFIKRDEDAVKKDITDNPSYRSSLYKAFRLAMTLGKTGIAFAINGYFGAVYLGIQALKVADRPRLKKEVQDELTAELEIIEERIKFIDHKGSYSNQIPEKYLEEKFRLIRQKQKIEAMLMNTPKSKIKSPRDVW